MLRSFSYTWPPSLKSVSYTHLDVYKRQAIVSRVVDSTQPPVLLAELKQGRAFGEDALISEAKRNATVTMKTDGRLLRLNKTDFIELLKAPLITQVDMEEAQQKVAEGAVWIDACLLYTSRCV